MHRNTLNIKTHKYLICFFVCLLLQNSNAYAAWNVTLDNNTSLPEKFIAVSKQNRHLYVIEDKNTDENFDVKQAFPAIYGEVEGDKIKQGDKKTPEGVYFVTNKIGYKLDFDEYGTGAYALNYPNPIDRIKRKTGGGIWIHSKGQPIEGQVTRGCIAVDLEHFPTVADNLTTGIPVVVANNLVSTVNEIMIDQAVLVADASQSGTATMYDATSEVSSSNSQELIDLTKKWNSAWEEMSQDFFELHDAEKYTLAQNESYETFKSQKESLFNRLDWIDIEYGEVYALEGTDYWVTWFEQLYRAPNLSTEGIRRLYWQQDEMGDYKVVAMEWLPRELGLEKAYVATLSDEVQSTILMWQAAWLEADIDNYSAFYANDAKQGNRKGSAIFDQKEQLWSNSKPTTIEIEDLKFSISGRDMLVSFKQNYADANGYSDFGQKTMRLTQVDGTWLIAEENWRRLNRE